MSAVVVALVLAAVLLWPGRAAALPGRTVRLAPFAPGRWWPRTRTGDLESLAGVADLLAMALRSGATPVGAVRVVSRQAPRPWTEVLEDVREQLATGGAAGAVWQHYAQRRPELGALAGAWTLSEDLGVALAPSMATSAQVLRAQVQARRRLDAATAGARATMRMLTLLPLVGAFAGLAFGLTPWEVYGHNAVTVTSAVVGLLLTTAGWVICRWVLARAAAPGRHP